MLTFGANSHSGLPRLDASSLENALATVGSSTGTVQRRNHHVTITDGATDSMARLAIEDPAVYEAKQRELALLTSQGDQFLLSQHGDNATQVRNQNAQQSLTNIADIEHKLTHTPVGRGVRSNLNDLPEAVRGAVTMLQNSDIRKRLQAQGIDPEQHEKDIVSTAGQLSRLDKGAENRGTLKKLSLAQHKGLVAEFTLRQQRLFEPIFKAAGFQVQSPESIAKRAMPDQVVLEKLLQAPRAQAKLAAKKVNAPTLDSPSNSASPPVQIESVEASPKKEKTDVQKAALKRKRARAREKRKSKNAEKEETQKSSPFSSSHSTPSVGRSRTNTIQNQS